MNVKKPLGNRHKKSGKYIYQVVKLFSGIALTGLLLCGCSGLADEPKEEDTTQRAETGQEASDTAGEEEKTAKAPAEEESMEAPAKEEAPPSEEELLEEQVSTLLEGMTLEEKIYQLFIVTPEQLTGVSEVTSAGETTKDSLTACPVGGLIYFAGNLKEPGQTKEMLSNVQEMSVEIEGVPLFLCVDEEGGKVSRIANNPAFSVTNVGPMAEVKSREEAFACGDTIGAYLSELGFNVDFAPDADVITNPENTVIGERSFGEDAETVTEYAGAYSEGLNAHHIMSALKHYPGHGATEADTHEGYAYTNKTYEQLQDNELKPFQAAKDNGMTMIMAAHISLPNVIGDDTPCSFSEKMIGEILRNDLGYGGLVVTDALNMGAVTNEYSSSSAAVAAVKAGVDLLLMPQDLHDAYNGIYQEVQDGGIAEERIDSSVERILRAKLTLRKFSDME